MQNSTKFLGLLTGSLLLPLTAMAADPGLMSPGTMIFPYTDVASFPPSSLDISWDNQPLELINPVINDMEEEVVMVKVVLGDEEPQEVGAALISSEADDGMEDVYSLSVGLYELDDLYSFDGNEIKVVLPQGIVKNQAGLVNPAQTFTFYIVPTYQDYTLTPETDSTLTKPDATLTVSFGGNEITYYQGTVVAHCYEPEYTEILLNLGKEVNINSNNELVIDLNFLPNGEYEILIPEGFLKVTVDGEENISTDIWVEYKLEGTMPEFMKAATLADPTTTMVSMVPATIDVTWNNQPIKLVNPSLNDFEEEVVMVKLILGDNAPVEVSAAILSSVADDGEDDVYNLQIALYDYEDLYDFKGDTFTVELPYGIVENKDGEINPAQAFVFTIVPTYTDYKITPESGSTLKVPGAIVKVSFGGNELKYVGGNVRALIYEPKYQEMTLPYGYAVSVDENNDLVINLNSLPAGKGTEIVIPEGMFSLVEKGVDYITPSLWLEFNIEEGSVGIDAIGGDSTNSPVFNLKGVKVGRTGATGNLSPGVYVIEGRKVVIK